MALYIYVLVPEFLWRFVGWLLAHTVYRIEMKGRELIPEEGAALLCPNHITYADALFLFALSPRPIRFVSEHSLFSIPVVGHLLRRVKAIPIASGRAQPRVMAEGFAAIDAALKAGELVCLFPEGQLTRTGEMSEFKAGVMKVLRDAPVLVYPVGIQGLWGSTLCRDGCTPAKKLLRWRPRRKVQVTVGSPLAAEAVTPESLQAAVKALL